MRDEKTHYSPFRIQYGIRNEMRQRTSEYSEEHEFVFNGDDTGEQPERQGKDGKRLEVTGKRKG